MKAPSRNDASKFSFITSKDFRSSLESDYLELKSCMESKSWKSVHVLSGSILEAILVDYLITEGIPEAVALKMMLGDAISECQKKGLVTQRAVDLSKVIQSYRNLIHPGRIVRLGEVVDENGAKIANALVDMIIDDVAKSRQLSFGYTAEQIVEKIQKDPVTVAIIVDIMKGTKSAELERLLELLPAAYFDQEPYYVEGEEFIDEEVLGSIEKCFREILENCDVEIRKRICRKIPVMITDDANSIVMKYIKIFFRADDLFFMDDDGVKIVKKYIFHGMENGYYGELGNIGRIGKYLNDKEYRDFVYAVLKVASSGRASVKKEAEDLIESTWYILPSGDDKKYFEYLKEYTDLYGEEKYAAWLAPVKNAIKSIEDGPFFGE